MGTTSTREIESSKGVAQSGASETRKQSTSTIGSKSSAAPRAEKRRVVNEPVIDQLENDMGSRAKKARAENTAEKLNRSRRAIKPKNLETEENVPVKKSTNTDFNVSL